MGVESRTYSCQLQGSVRHEDSRCHPTWGDSEETQILLDLKRKHSGQNLSHIYIYIYIFSLVLTSRFPSKKKSPQSPRPRAVRLQGWQPKDVTRQTSALVCNWDFPGPASASKFDFQTWSNPSNLHRFLPSSQFGKSTLGYLSWCMGFPTLNSTSVVDIAAPCSTCHFKIYPRVASQYLSWLRGVVARDDILGWPATTSSRSLQPSGAEKTSRTTSNAMDFALAITRSRVIYHDHDQDLPQNNISR